MNPNKVKIVAALVIGMVMGMLLCTNLIAFTVTSITLALCLALRA